MTIPSYVAGIDYDTYQSMRRDGKFYSTGNKKPETLEHVASIFMVAAVESDPEKSWRLLHGSIQGTPPLAELLKKGDAALLRDGMDYAVTKLFNFEAHGAAALAFLAETTIYDEGCTRQWSANTVLQLLEELEKIPFTEIEYDVTKSGTEHAVEARAMEKIQSLAIQHIRDLSADAEKVKEKFLSYAVKYLKEMVQSGQKLPFLNAGPAIFIELFASENDINALRELVSDAYDMDEIKKSGAFHFNKKHFSRLLNENAIPFQNSSPAEP